MVVRDMDRRKLNVVEAAMDDTNVDRDRHLIRQTARSSSMSISAFQKPPDHCMTFFSVLFNKGFTIIDHFRYICV